MLGQCAKGKMKRDPNSEQDSEFTYLGKCNYHKGPTSIIPNQRWNWGPLSDTMLVGIT